MKKSEKRGKEPVHISRTPEWLKFLNPLLFPPGVSSLSQLPDSVCTFHCLHNAACKPYPDWPLIIRVSLMQFYIFSYVLKLVFFIQFDTTLSVLLCTYST